MKRILSALIAALLAFSVHAQTVTTTAANAPPAGSVAITNVTGLGTNCGAFLATPSSTNLIACITDETGTGALVFAGGDVGNLLATGAGPYLLGAGGANTAYTTLNPQIQNHGTTLSTSAATIYGWLGTTATNGINFIGARSRGASVGSRVAVASGDRLGQWLHGGDDGAAFANSTAIRSTVDNTVSSGVVPGKISFMTANTSGTLTDGLTIDSTQAVKVPTPCTAATCAATIDGTQTLTNKTITAPVINGAATFSSVTVAQGTAANMTVPYVVCQSAVNVNAPADTNENTLYTCTIPANALGANGHLRIAVNVSGMSGTGTKTLRVRYSGGAGTIMCATAGTSGLADGGFTCYVANRNATNSQVGGASGYPTANNGGFGTTVTRGTSAVDTTASSTVVVTFQKATAGDGGALDRVLVELMYGA